MCSSETEGLSSADWRESQRDGFFGERPSATRSDARGSEEGVQAVTDTKISVLVRDMILNLISSSHMLVCLHQLRTL